MVQVRAKRSQFMHPVGDLVTHVLVLRAFGAQAGSKRWKWCKNNLLVFTNVDNAYRDYLHLRNRMIRSVRTPFPGCKVGECSVPLLAQRHARGEAATRSGTRPSIALCVIQRAFLLEALA